MDVSRRISSSRYIHVYPFQQQFRAEGVEVKKPRRNKAIAILRLTKGAQLTSSGQHQGILHQAVTYQSKGTTKSMHGPGSEISCPVCPSKNVVSPIPMV
mgnify:CR=1 FL=1